MSGGTKPKRYRGGVHDGDVHALVCISKAMKTIPRPNITGLIMRLGLVKKPVADYICTFFNYVILVQWVCPFAFVLLSFCVSLIYVHSSTPHITCIYNRGMVYYINIVLARNVWHSRIPPRKKSHTRTRDVTRNATRSDATANCPGRHGHLIISSNR